MALIRLADVHDAAAISHVHVQSWLTTYEGLVPKEYLDSLNEAERTPLWRDWLTRDVVVLVAEIDEEVVGFAGCGAIREPFGDYDAELYAVYLLKHAQGLGAGKALLNSVVDAVAQKGHMSMLVWVLEQNPAVGFYAKAGAQRLMCKQLEIGGVYVPELALGWPDVRQGLSWRTASDKP